MMIRTMTNINIENCAINYHGSSVGVEADAGIDIFIRSIETRRLKYTTFVGSCFAKVRDGCAARYGDQYPVVKEECNGHVQKRMGGGLRELKLKRTGHKVSDGKDVGGAGRLTDAMIDRPYSK